MKRLFNLKNWMRTTLFCILAIAVFWQSAFLSSSVAMADSNINSLLLANTSDRVQDKVDKDAGRAKNFIEDTKDKVQDAAKSNAAKVDRATDNGGFFERKAKRDAARIEQKAEKDAARTKRAVDKSKKTLERTVDDVKDNFSN
jgi:uncharacterized protein YjbJ (UPF0337 family)